MRNWLVVVVLLVSRMAAGTACDGTAVCNTTTNTKYATIEACTGTMSAGDTCKIYAGTYNPAASLITVPAGDSTHTNTVQVNGDDLVTINGTFVVNSYTQIIGGNTPKPTTTGMHVQNTAAPASADCVYINPNSTHITIQNVNFYACGQNGMITGNGVFGTYPSWVYIIGDKFSYCGGTIAAPNACNVMFANGDHWLVDNVDISHSRGIKRIGSYGVFRNYTQHDFVGTDPTAGSATSGGKYDLLDGSGNPVHDCSNQLNGVNKATIVGNTVYWQSGTNNYGQEFYGSWITVPVASGGDGTTRYNVIGFPAHASGPTCVAGVPSACLTVDGSPPQITNQAINGGIGSACHADFWSAEPSSASHFNLVEGAGVYNHLGNDSKGGLTQGDACSGNCDHAIFRFNWFNHIGSGNASDENAGKPAPGFSYVKHYNETIVNPLNYKSTLTAGSATINSYGFGSNYASDKNNLVLIDNSTAGTNIYLCWNKSAGTSVCSGGVGTPGDNFDAGHNIAGCTSASCRLYGQVYQTGNFIDNVTGSSNNLQFLSVVATAWFASYSACPLGTYTCSADDLHLVGGSPALIAGSSLTTVASGGGANVTSAVFADAAYFQDGYGLAGVNADVVAIGNTANRTTIASIDYATNTVNFMSPITISNGDQVWLANRSDKTNVLTGAAPNVGAFGTSASPPFTLTVSVGGSSTGYITGTNGIDCGTTPGHTGCSVSYNFGDPTPTYTQHTSTGSFIAWGGTAAIAGGCTTGSTCTSAYPNDNSTLSATFSTVPVVTISVDTPYCNVLQKSCTPTVSVTGTGLGVASGSFSVVDGSGAPIVDTLTGLQAVCFYGVVNAFCGDGTMTGPWTIHTTIANWNTSLAQESATVNAYAGEVPATCTPSCTVYVGLTGRDAGPTIH